MKKLFTFVVLLFVTMLTLVVFEQSEHQESTLVENQQQVITLGFKDPEAEPDPTIPGHGGVGR